MSTAAIRLQFTGAIKDRLRKLQSQGRDLSPVMRIIQLDLIRSTARNFQALGRRDDQTRVWPELSPVTIKMRREGQKKKGRGRSIKPLRDTGRLFDSIEHPAGNEVGPRHAQVGTIVPYAPDHQQDGNFGGKKRKTIRRDVPAHERRIRVKNKRGRMVEKRVPVKAYVQESQILLPARPFFNIHRSDIRRASSRVSTWAMRGPGTTGLGNTQGGVPGG